MQDILDRNLVARIDDFMSRKADKFPDLGLDADSHTEEINNYNNMRLREAF